MPGFDGANLSHEWKEALWARFFTAAPRRQRQFVERYSIVKRAYVDGRNGSKLYLRGLKNPPV
jgi:hypothetical protein